MPVNAEHPEYRAIAPRWRLVRDIVENNAMRYIRTVDVEDYNRSQQYKEDAILMNFTRLTKNGLTGLVFRKESKVELPEDLDYLMEDATGTGLDLDDLAKFLLSELQQTGRAGLLVDYPTRNEEMSLLDDEQMQFKARIKPYVAESIINWKTVTIGSKTMPSMVVLREIYDCIDEKDGFDWVEKVQYRVLYLGEDGAYRQSVWDNNYNLIEDVMPVDAEGNPFYYIPFYFVGSEDNDWHIDPIPLYDLAVLNLGHYRNSADYEESIFLNGQPTAILGGDVDPDQFVETYGTNIKIGSRAVYYLGSGAKGEFMQTNPNQLADTAMRRKEDQAVAIGARLIAPATGRETAEGVKVRYAAQNSALHILVENVSKAMQSALDDVARFMGADEEEIVYNLNRQFYEETADPQLLAQQIMLLDRGVIAEDDVRDYMRRTSAIDSKRTNEDIDDEVNVTDVLRDIDPNDNRE